MSHRNTLSHLSAGLFCAALLSNTFSTQANAAAQPPAQGPPAASQNALSVPVDALTGTILLIVNSTVAAENAILAVDPNHRAVISASIQAHTPYMTTTTHPNKPNQLYADVPYTLTYHVTGIQAKVLGVWVPYPFDRDITQDLELEATCEGWYTGSGTLTYTAVPFPAVLQGDHSFAEDALGSLLLGVIPNFVDSVIRDALKTIPLNSATINSGVPCRTLGVSNKAQGFPFDSVNFDPPTIHLPVGTPVSQILVSVTKVHRLQVRASDGTPVYNAIEAPHFDFYAGFSHLFIQLPPMSEGQTIDLTHGNTVTTQVPPASESLVLIGNLSSGNDDVNADYAFLTFASPAFGNGTHILSVPKHWTETSRTQGLKLVTLSSPGYQITLSIGTPSGQTTTAQ